jgi:hypothetical protein
MTLEGRLSRLETRLDKMELTSTASINELHKNVNSDRETIQNRFTSLIERMNSLENAVESEHETSLDLLEVLIQKNEGKKLSHSQQHQQSSRSNRGPHGSGGGGGGGGGALNSSKRGLSNTSVSSR